MVQPYIKYIVSLRFCLKTARSHFMSISRRFTASGMIRNPSQKIHVFPDDYFFGLIFFALSNIFLTYMPV